MGLNRMGLKPSERIANALKNKTDMHEHALRIVSCWPVSIRRPYQPRGGCDEMEDQSFGVRPFSEKHVSGTVQIKDAPLD